MFVFIVNTIETRKWNKGICKKTNKKWEINAIGGAGMFDVTLGFKRQYTDNCGNYLLIRLGNCDKLAFLDEYSKDKEKFDTINQKEQLK
jgi:hypothetical protein